MLNNSFILQSYYKFRENYDEEIFQNEEYKAVSKDLEKIWTELERFFPVDKKELLFRLDESFSIMLAFDSRRSYIYGFIDGANLISILKTDLLRASDVTEALK